MPNWVLPRRGNVLVRDNHAMTKHSAMFRSVAIIVLGLSTSLPAAAVSNTSAAAESRPAAKPCRMIVLTDIGAEVDDTESMVRLLLYSDVIDLQGLVATTSTWKRTSVSPQLIQDVIAAYAKVHANLVKHDANYPPAATLQALVKRGLA